MGSNEKKLEKQGVDLTYAANTGTAANPPDTVSTTPSADVSYGANGGIAASSVPVTGTSGPNISYGANSGVFSFTEWAKNEEERLEREKDLTYKRAEELRQQEYENAAIARQRAIADARVSYAQNRAGYGARAEQLGSMGLAGSGYSDYVDSQAYATQRAEVQYANAQEQAAKRQARYAEQEAKYGADVSYSANMSALGKEQATYYEAQLNEEQKELYNSLVAQVQSGTLTKEQATQQARAGGLSDAIIGMITATADSYIKTEGEKKETESYNAILANINAGNYATVDDAKAAAEAAGITNANLVSQLVAAWNTRNNANYTNLLELARNGTWTAADIKALAQKYGVSGDDLVTLEETASAAYTAAEAEKGQISDETYNQNYATIEQMAKSGAYTADEIRGWCERLKIDDTADVTALTNAATAAQNKAQAEAEGELAGTLGNDVAVIESQMATGKVSPEAGEAAIEIIQEDNYNAYKGDIEGGFADTTAIDEALERREITDVQHQQLKKLWRDGIDMVNFFLSNGTPIGKKAAQEALKSVTDNPWCDSTIRNRLTDLFNTTYTPIRHGITNSSGSENEISGTGGGGYKVELGDDKFWVKSGGKCEASDPVYEIAEGVSNNEVFGWNRTVYIKKNGTVYKVESYGAGKGYSKIYHILFGNQ